MEFKATLKGTPPFTIKWFKEDLELASGPTCFIGIEGSTGFLTLYSVDSSRSGHYTCHVSNDVGSDSCTTTLLVTGVHSFLLCCYLFVSFFSFLFAKPTLVIFDTLPSEFPTLCLQPTVVWLFSNHFLSSISSDLPDPTVFGFLEPPKFAKKLEATKVVKQGDSARLECKVSGSPEMKVVWFRNDHEIVASEKFRTSFIDSVAVLEMNHLSTDESGDYICEAHNPAGKASCSTKVTVKG